MSVLLLFRKSSFHSSFAFRFYFGLFFLLQLIPIAEAQFSRDTLEREIIVQDLKNWLENAPAESASDALTKIIVVELPSPDGNLIEYKAIYSPVLGKSLRAEYPDIKSYYIEQIDKPQNNGRMTLSNIGLSAIIYHEKGRYRIRPTLNNFHEVFLAPLKADGLHEFGGDITYINPEGELLDPNQGQISHSHGKGPKHTHGKSTARFATSIGLNTRRVVDLWVVGDFEYYNNYGANVVASITSQINDVNAIITRDLNIRMNLKYFSYFNVSNQDDAYFPTASNGNPSMPVESLNYFDAAVSGVGTDLPNDNLSGVVTTGDFDYGFYVSGKASSPFSGQGASLLFTNGDGIICSNQGVNFGSGTQIPLKAAAGAAAGSFLITTTIWIDLITHEMGHSLGSQHTWTGRLGNCTPNQYGELHAYEPASGTTMMSYEGSCGGDNVPVSGGEDNAYFHIGSVQAINKFFTNPEFNNPTCVTTEANNNANIPVLNCTNCSGTNLVIPQNTPFYLTATGNDGDGDVLKYNWEQSDLAPQVSTANGYPVDGYVNNLAQVAATNGTALFRSFEPTTSGNTRYIPNLSYLASGSTAWNGELLPTTSRTISMQFTAKDTKGGVVSKMLTLTVDGVATDFEVTSQTSNVNYTGGSTQIVTWNVGGTDANGINCGTVNILLSSDGGNSYTQNIASNVPNNGTASVTIPNIATSQARIMVECNRDCVKFFNINSSNFTITATSCPTPSIGTISNPTTCTGIDGSIQIIGLDANTTYNLSYKRNGNTVNVGSVNSDGSGNYSISGLTAGSYTEINFVDGVCTSNLSTTLSDPDNPNPSLGTISDPTTCNGTNGSIQLTGLENNTSYSVSYRLNGGTPMTSTISSNGSGQLVIPNLEDGSYTEINVTANSCTSSDLSTTLTDPATPTPSLGTTTNPTTCGGTDGTIQLTALANNTSYSVSYTQDSGSPTTSTLSSNGSGVLIISGLSAGIYEDIEVTVNGCTSSDLSTTLTDPMTPSPSLGTTTNPTTCGGTDGTIQLTGLANSTSYSVSYTQDSGSPTTNTLSSNGSGELTIMGLSSGSYTEIKVTVNGCTSSGLSTTLADPTTPSPSLGTTTNPTTCGGTDGTVQLTGLANNTSYSVSYTQDSGSPTTITLSSNSSGELTINGLSAGSYADINVTVNGCTSGNLSTNLVDPTAVAVTSTQDGETYRAINTLTCAIAIPDAHEVTFEAGQSITLGVGFSKKGTVGGTFTAQIVNCNTLQEAPIAETRSKESVSSVLTLPQLTLQPNPATEEVGIRYELPEKTTVRIQLYDLTGKAVRTIVPFGSQQIGQYQLAVPIGDLEGGMYIVVMQQGRQVISKKLIVLN